MRPGTRHDPSGRDRLQLLAGREHFPGLDPEIRDRLTDRGLDLDASYEAFIVEVLVKIPPRLVEALSGGRFDLPGERIHNGRARVLTVRQRLVLSYLAAGDTVGTAAPKLGVTYLTAKDHVKKATHRLGAANTTNAVAIAIRLELI